SVFHLHYSDRFFAAFAWTGAVIAPALAAGAADQVPLWAAMPVRPRACQVAGAACDRWYV
ncbi:hypothetical protein H3146_20250, partial [Streptomyces sp. OF3]